MFISLFSCLTLDFVDGDYAVGAYHSAAGAADALVIYGLGIVITFAVHIFR
jgi:hypothetical protein